MLRLHRVSLLAALTVASLLTADGFSNSALRLARRPLLPLVNTKPLPRIRPATLGPILIVSLTAPIGIVKVGGAVLKAYLVLLDTAPLLTKVITAMVVSTTGDVIAQHVAHRAAQKDLPPALQKMLPLRKLDLRRTAMFMFFGGFYTGAVQHVWFGFLNSAALSPYLPEGTVSRAIARALVNQLCWVPWVYFSLFYAWRGYCRRETPAQTLVLARREWWPTLKLNWKFWIPAQTVLFAVFPPVLQVPVCCLLALIWSSMLSFVSMRSLPVGGKDKDGAAASSVGVGAISNDYLEWAAGYTALAAARSDAQPGDAPARARQRMHSAPAPGAAGDAARGAVEGGRPGGEGASASAPLDALWSKRGSKTQGGARAEGAALGPPPIVAALAPQGGQVLCSEAGARP